MSTNRRSPEEEYHATVLLTEAVDGLAVKPGSLYVDATVGGGGHTAEVIRRGGRVIGIDADADAIGFTDRRLRRLFPGREKEWVLVRGNFRDIAAIAQTNNIGQTGGVLMDLGASGHQFDTGSRGFSFRFQENEADMRFDQRSGQKASELIGNATERELYEILSRFGEEQLAGPIAHALVVARAVGDIRSTGDVVRVVMSVAPPGRRDETLARVFQGLRIAVNDELSALRAALDGVRDLVRENGRLVVISFHSLEDRIVKQWIRKNRWTTVTKKPIRPSDTEMHANPRSRSAKMRIAEKA